MSVEPKLNHLQEYLVQEFVDDYHEGHMTRRELLSRVLGITGGVASAATVLLTLGCAPAQPASPTAAATAGATAGASAAATAAPTKPSAAAPTTGAAAAPGTPGSGPTPVARRSPLSVAANDPAITASEVTYPGEGVTIMAYLAQPSAGGPFPAIMVCHENRGTSEHFKDVARRLAKAGYVAIAVDLLSRDGGTARVDPSQVPGKLSADPARNVSDFQATFKYLQGLPAVQRANVGMMGFCFGGGVTWMVATAIPELKAAVPYYGANPPLSEVPKIQAAVLGIYGETDQRITSMVPAIEEAMRQNGKTFEKVIYPGAGHAFYNETGANYNEQAATNAWQRTLDWFKRYLV